MNDQPHGIRQEPLFRPMDMAAAPAAISLPFREGQKPTAAGVNTTARSRKRPAKGNGNRKNLLKKDALYIVRRNNACNIVSENYGYKTEAYYTILQHELEGKTVMPSSSGVLDAFIVPLCLEKAARAGIPVCEWGISQAYVPLPAILYGLNYFATTSEYIRVDNSSAAKEAIRHITNNGRYPFCYQRLTGQETFQAVTAVFGTCLEPDEGIALCAEEVYRRFSLPLARLLFVRNSGSVLLSSLAPVRYAQLQDDERRMLCAHMTGQGFL